MSELSRKAKIFLEYAVALALSNAIFRKTRKKVKGAFRPTTRGKCCYGVQRTRFRISNR